MILQKISERPLSTLNSTYQEKGNRLTSQENVAVVYRRDVLCKVGTGLLLTPLLSSCNGGIPGMFWTRSLIRAVIAGLSVVDELMVAMLERQRARGGPGPEDYVAQLRLRNESRKRVTGDVLTKVWEVNLDTNEFAWEGDHFQQAEVSPRTEASFLVGQNVMPIRPGLFLVDTRTYYDSESGRVRLA